MFGAEEAERHVVQPGLLRSHQGLHRGGLVDGAPERAADRRVVERRLQVVHLHHADEAGRIERADPHIARAAQQVELVVVGVFLPVLLAGDERVGGRGRVRHDAPLDPVEMHDLGPGGPGQRAVAARHVALEFRVDVAIDPGTRSSALKRKGPLPTSSVHLAEGIGVGQPLRHHGADRDGRLAERDGQQREGPLQAEADRAVVGRGELVRRVHQDGAEGVALRPAAEAGDAVAGQDLLAVMEAQALAQRQVPALAVVLDAVPVHHLRRGSVLAVHAVQRVEHHVAVVAGDVGEGGHGVERHHVLLRREAERGGGLRPHGGRSGERC